MQKKQKQLENKDDESLLSHLEALRTTVIHCLMSMCVVLPFALYLSPKLLNFLTKILSEKNNITLNYFSPMEVFIIQLKLALLISLIVASPYIAKKIWDFLLPALYDNEKKFIKRVVILSSLLFIIGSLFCLFVILPFIINFGVSFSNQYIKATFNITNVINLCIGLSAVFGLMFQIPLVVNFLIKFDIIDYNDISDKRPYVVIVLLIISAFLTPPDIVSQILLAIPTYLLFESGLLFSRKYKK